MSCLLLFFAGIPIKEVVGLRPNMYSLTYDIMRKDAVRDEIIHTEEMKVVKGIAKCEIKKTLRHEMYKNCLLEETTTMNSMWSIRSKNHELYIDLLNKKGLCSFDDKRYWINPVESYAFGHYRINV
jgi:hypothetical protein